MRSISFYTTQSYYLLAKEEKERLRVALIFNPFKYKVHEENLKIVQKYFGMFPPLSLAWVAAIAENAGHKVIIIDARTLGLAKEEVLDRIRQFKPDLLGLMMTTYMFPETLEWITFFKSHLKIPVLIGGYNLRVYPIESLSHPEIDFGCVRHAINTVPQLLNEFESGRRNFNEVVGLVYRENNHIRVNPPDPEPIDFNSFPFPARHLLPNQLYAEFPTQRKSFTVMVTSLGCPYQCSFCEASRTPYSPRIPKLVVDEMQECYTKYKIREIDIFDYEFTAIRSRIEQICDEIIKRNLDIEWACRSRIDMVDDKLLDKMKQAGCRRVYFGIESGCQEILNRINKGITLNQIRKTIYLTKSKGIQALGFFLAGAPGDTHAIFKRTLRFAKELDLDYVQFSKCLAKPLTPLWRQMIEKTGKDYWRDWILGKESDHELPRPWTQLSNNEIHHLTKRAYIEYHIRPLRILKSVLQVRSLSELRRKTFAFFDMLFKQENEPVEDKNFKVYDEFSRKKIKPYRDPIKSQDLIFIKATGFSMWPFIKGGEKIIIKKVPIEDFKIGDIILYRSNNKIVCHRLIKKNGHKKAQLFYVRGDNSLSSPELITEQMYLGKVVSILKDGKMISFAGWRQYSINRIIVLIAPVVSWGARIIKPYYHMFRNNKRLRRK